MPTGAFSCRPRGPETALTKGASPRMYSGGALLGHLALSSAANPDKNREDRMLQ